MTAQDVILSAGGWFFAIALVPMVFKGPQPPLLTSVATGTILAVFAVVYATLDLQLAMVTTAITSVMWAAAAAKTIAKRCDA